MKQKRKHSQGERTSDEAVPSFSIWRRRLEEKARTLCTEVEQFLETLKVLGTPMIEEPAVHFVYYNPAAQSVAVSGEFTQWDPQGIPMTRLGQTEIFYHTAEFHEPARVEYKFIVDGQWMVDPLCPNVVDNGIDAQNSVFVVGDAQGPPELEWIPTIPHGRVEEFDFKSRPLRNQRHVSVYLPPDYDRDSHRLFPSLYVHDGSEYLTRAKLATVIDNLLHERAIVPLIVVMMDPVDRVHEYHANEDYVQAMEHELIPHIDRRYRTPAQREARGVIGASLGGLMATYLALSRPHLFSKVGGQSSTLFLEQEKLLALVDGLGARICFYFDVGAYEPQFLPAHKQLVPLLEAKGCPCFFQELTGGHNWTSWRAHLKDLLSCLWKREDTAIIDSMPQNNSAGSQRRKQ
ncbi:MAG: alpha/beta hydrolase-fold protein [Candidatus Binatia bacterium]